MNSNKIEVRNVFKNFGEPTFLSKVLRRTERNVVVRALDDVNMTVAKGEVVGIVGESGCGKSTLGRIISGIMPPTRGTVLLDGQDVESPEMARSPERRLKVQMIFQDPTSSLNPRRRVHDIVGEAPKYHKLVAPRDIDLYVDEQLRRAGLDPSAKGRLPHQFSGGQRQRIGIARALAVNPDVLVCDESVAALDVSIQAQILNLLMDLREQLGLTCVFISHDLSVVEHISDRVIVMYLGRIVEEATVEDLFRSPAHPYTQALLAEVPRLDGGKKEFSTISGEIPSPLSPPSGCHFHPRCPHAMPVCKTTVPVLAHIQSGHRSACHLHSIKSSL